jgi:soluble lytic murein transglycosylase-like protein
LKPRRDRLTAMPLIDLKTACRMARNLVPVALGLALAPGAAAYAAERITLTNGFDLICDHHSAAGDRVRLYMDSGNANFVELNAAEIASSEHVELQPPASKAAETLLGDSRLTPAELHELLARAGNAHDLDVDLLASVVRQESRGNSRAVSPAGAEGLMQLMPGTAAKLGVSNAFAPEANIDGGTAYLDSMLRRYHDNVALALAAYDAGPAAVDRWHGIPPYRETRTYVARVIHEFNRRVAARQVASATR